LTEYVYNAAEKELKGGDEAAAMRDFHIAHAFLAAATPANAPGAQDQNNPPQTSQ
jgi:hypothetical protein